MRLPRTPHDIIALRNKAFEIIKERSFSRGRFVLASGRESNYYLDMKPSMNAVNSRGSSAAGFNLGDALVVAAMPPVFSTRATAMSPTREHAITSARRVFTSPLA